LTFLGLPASLLDGISQIAVFHKAQKLCSFADFALMPIACGGRCIWVNSVF